MTYKEIAAILQSRAKFPLAQTLAHNQRYWRILADKPGQKMGATGLECNNRGVGAAWTEHWFHTVTPSSG
jgi:hypothetical protein